MLLAGDITIDAPVIEEQRLTRTDVFDARASAVYLPPGTEVRRRRATRSRSSRSRRRSAPTSTPNPARTRTLSVPATWSCTTAVATAGNARCTT